MWLIIGLIVGAGLAALSMFLRNRDIKVTWYEWLIGIVGLLLLLLTIQNFGGSLIELESTAAWWMVLTLGLPALILMTVAWQLAWRRHRAA